MLAGLLMIAATGPGQAQETADDSASEEAIVLQQGSPAAEPPLEIDSESSFTDLRSGVTRFEGNVTITRGEMEVLSDNGTVRQVEGQITEVELEGSPTTWKDRLEDGSPVQGESRRIHFDVLKNVITLSGNAVIRHARGQYEGDELVYDLTRESLSGRGNADERVRVVIEPEAFSDQAPDDERTPDDN